MGLVRRVDVSLSAIRRLWLRDPKSQDCQELEHANKASQYIQGLIQRWHVSGAEPAHMLQRASFGKALFLYQSPFILTKFGVFIDIDGIPPTEPGPVS